MTDHKALPVKGYSSQSTLMVELVNKNKEMSGDPAAACAARLFKRLIPVITDWLDDEARRKTRMGYLLNAASNASLMIIGSVAANLPPEIQRQAMEDMRDHLVNTLDKNIEEFMKEQR